MTTMREEHADHRLTLRAQEARSYLIRQLWLDVDWKHSEVHDSQDLEVWCDTCRCDVGTIVYDKKQDSDVVQFYDETNT